MGLKKLLLLNQTIYLFSNLLIYVVPKMLDYLILKPTQLFVYTKYKLLYFLVLFLKFFGFSRLASLIDLAVVDYPNQKYRFKLVYNFFSYNISFRFLIVIFVKELQKVFSVA